MTEPVHPLFRSERRFAWVLQVVIVVAVLGLLVADLVGGDEPPAGSQPTSPTVPAASDASGPDTGTPGSAAPSTVTTDGTSGGNPAGTTAPTTTGPPATPTCYLGNKLTCSLRGTKISQVKCRICIDDTHKHNVWKIKTFCNHLCPNK